MFLSLALSLLLLAQALAGCVQPVAVAPPATSPPASIILIPGEEDTSVRVHMLALNISNPTRTQIEAGYQEHIDAVTAQGGLVIMNHPDEAPWTIALGELMTFKNYTGIELSYDSHSKWDAVLTGRVDSGAPLVWGLMTDDSHREAGCGWRFIMVRAPAATMEDIIDAIRQGSFYWGSAALINDITLTGRDLNVTLSEPADVQFITSGGKVAKEAHGSTASYAIQGNEGYVRVDVRAGSRREAGTQPFRVTPTGIDNPYAASGQWYRGNLHAHTLTSDGTQSADQVIRWYSDHGYTFLAITDHVHWNVTGP